MLSLQVGADQAFAPEPNVPEQWLEPFRQRASFARAVGCDCIGLWPGSPLGNQTIEEGTSL